MARKTLRGANNTGTVRKRADGRWEARVIVGTDPGTGKAIRKSIYGATQKEVVTQQNAILAAVENGTYQAPQKLTVGAWVDEWFEIFCAPNVKPYTYSSYKRVIARHIKPRLGAIQLQALKGHDIQRFYNELRKSGATVSKRDDSGKIVRDKNGKAVKEAAPMEPKTVTNIAAVLHKSLEIAVKQGLLQANPCDNATLPKAKRKEIKPLTDAEIPIFLKAIDSHPMRNVFALCLFTGLREGECLGMSWDCIDFEKREITVRQQLQKGKEAGSGYFIADSTKSSKQRVVPLPPIALECLKDEKRRQNENRLRMGKDWCNKHDLVFTSPTGENLKISTVYKSFKRIAADIGRPDARPHDLRHTAATVAIASGADIKSVQDLLGHATASFTLNVYAHTSEKMKQDTANRVQSYYDKIDKA